MEHTETQPNNTATFDQFLTGWLRQIPNMPGDESSALRVLEIISNQQDKMALMASNRVNEALNLLISTTHHQAVRLRSEVKFVQGPEHLSKDVSLIHEFVSDYPRGGIPIKNNKIRDTVTDTIFWAIIDSVARLDYIGSKEGFRILFTPAILTSVWDEEDNLGPCQKQKITFELRYTFDYPGLVNLHDTTQLKERCDILSANGFFESILKKGFHGIVLQRFASKYRNII